MKVEAKKIPCKDCDHRVLRCHSTCEEWIKYSAEVNELKQKKRQAKLYDDITYQSTSRRFKSLTTKKATATKHKSRKYSKGD